MSRGLGPKFGPEAKSVGADFLVLKVLAKTGAIGNTLPWKGILTKQGTYIMPILGLGTGTLNDYHVCIWDPQQGAVHRRTLE